jgi:hypothetical protein
VLGSGRGPRAGVCLGAPRHEPRPAAPHRTSSSAAPIPANVPSVALNTIQLTSARVSSRATCSLKERQFVEDHGEVVASLVGLAKGEAELGIVGDGGPGRAFRLPTGSMPRANSLFRYRQAALPTGAQQSFRVTCCSKRGNRNLGEGRRQRPLLFL